MSVDLLCDGTGKSIHPVKGKQGLIGLWGGREPSQGTGPSSQLRSLCSWFSAVLLKHERVAQLPGRLVKTLTARFCPGLLAQVGPEVCISGPRDTDAAGLGTTLSGLLLIALRSTVSVEKGLILSPF